MPITRESSAPRRRAAVISPCAQSSFDRRLWLPAVAIAMLVTGCGGGSGVEPPPPITQPPPLDNQPPTAIAGCGTTPQRASFTGFLQAMDSDNSENELLFSLDLEVPNVSGPLATDKGTVELLDSTTGKFRYTPSASGSRGIDSFQFRVDDPDSFAIGAERVIIDPAIMPLGDSITAGILGNNEPPESERVGYRGPLYSSLRSMGFPVDLVGSQSGGQNAAPPIGDPNNEGYGGATAENIAFGGRAGGSAGGFIVPPVLTALEENPADVVLLHIGTNDINFDDPNLTIMDIEDILNEIGRWEASPNGNAVTVLIAEIIERTTLEEDGLQTCDGCNENVAALNTLIRSIPASRPADDIIVANQHDALIYPDDMNPQIVKGKTVFIHPDAAGYAKMAATWLPALVESGRLATCEQ